MTIEQIIQDIVDTRINRDGRTRAGFGDSLEPQTRDQAMLFQGNGVTVLSEIVVKLGAEIDSLRAQLDLPRPD